MTPLELLVAVRRHGADLVVGLDEKLTLKKRSAVPNELANEVRSHVDDLRALLRERLPATAHRYVVWRGAINLSHSVCLSCGIPASMHGGPWFLDDALVLDDPNDAPLIEAYAIVAAAVAEAAR